MAVKKAKNGRSGTAVSDTKVLDAVDNPWKVGRIFLEWGALLACVVALVQGAGGLQPWSITVLTILGWAAATTAIFEHRWHKTKPWHAAGCAMGALMVVCLLGFVAWPRSKPPLVANISPTDKVYIDSLSGTIHQPGKVDAYSEINLPGLSKFLLIKIPDQQAYASLSFLMWVEKIKIGSLPTYLAATF
jgi:hypothetical protein